MSKTPRVRFDYFTFPESFTCERPFINITVLSLSFFRLLDLTSYKDLPLSVIDSLVRNRMVQCLRNSF